MRSALPISALVLCLAGGLHAQVSGDVKGVVTDASGGVVQQAKITLTSRETGETRGRNADARGRFVFNQLKIGPYTLLVEAAGFRQAVAEATVRSGEAADLSIQLEIGMLSEK